MAHYPTPVGPRPRPFLDDDMAFARHLHYHLSYDGTDDRIDHLFLHERVMRQLDRLFQDLPTVHQAAVNDIRDLTIATFNDLFMAGIEHGVALEAFRQSLLRIDAQRRHPDRQSPDHRVAQPDEWDYWWNRPASDHQASARPTK